MSYILDALKKSEQDRGNGSIPSVQTVHSSSLNYHQEKRALWPWILIAVLIANVAILVYFLKPDMNAQNVTANSDAPEKNNNAIPLQNKTAAENYSAPAVVTTPPIATATEQTAPVTDNHIITNETTLVATPAQLIDIDELPANIRQQIPNMVFSAHVYSSNPAQRSLVINNRFMEEGDTVDYDLVLLEITSHGAIFDFRGHRFSTGILSGWSTN
ncbi:general secretion pathway protein GspB [Pseudomonadota bacterium]